MEPSNAPNQTQEFAERDGHNTAVLKQGTTDPETKEQPSQPEAPHKSSRKWLLFAALGVGAIVLAILGIRWWQYGQTHEGTDDAYVSGHIHPVTARISGTVTQVLVDDNQVVSQGTLLVKLDPHDYEASLQQAQAALLAAHRNADVAQANIGVVSTNAQGQTTTAQGDISAAAASISTAKAAVTEAQAGVPVAQAQLAQVNANLIKARLDYQRSTQLYQDGAVSKQELDAAKANYDALLAQYNAVKEQGRQAQAKVTQAQENLSNARAKLASTRGSLQQANATGKQTEVNRQQYKAAVAAIAQSEAQVKTAQLQLSYTRITAPTAGQVGNKTVEVGQRVQPGQALMSIVQQQPWVIANFKETQLEEMQPGQSVEIKLDALPHHVFRGKINSLSPASGARFALLPPDNATGNFTKIVQRIPVKIVFDSDSIKGYESRITPGMSAVITVEVP